MTLKNAGGKNEKKVKMLEWIVGVASKNRVCLVWYGMVDLWSGEYSSNIILR